MWYFKVGGEKKGPFPESTVWKLYETGAVRDGTPTQEEGVQDWAPFSVTALFRAMPPGVSPPKGGGAPKTAVTVVVVVLTVAVGFFGFRLWNNTHNIAGAWQGRNVLGLTLTLYFKHNAKVGDGYMDVLYAKGSGDDPAYSFYYSAKRVSFGVYRVDLCNYSATSGTIDEMNAKHITMTLGWDGGAQIDGFGGGYSAFSRIGAARAKSIIGQD